MAKITLTLLIAGVFAYACSLFEECDDCFTPPQTMVLRLTDKTTGENLLANGMLKSDSIKIYYVQDTQKKQVTLYFQAIEGRDTLIFTDDLSWKSVSEHRFYLETNSGDLDTLDIETVEKHSRCCTFFTLNYIRYNDNDIAANQGQIVVHNLPR